MLLIATEVMNGFAMKDTKAQATKIKPTAAACYAERHTECEKLLKRIAFQLDVHRGCQAQDPANWGYAADLGRVNEELASVLAGLGDRSAVEQKGLED